MILLMFPQKLIRNHTQGESRELGCETVVAFLVNGSFVLQIGGQRMHKLGFLLEV